MCLCQLHSNSGSHQVVVTIFVCSSHHFSCPESMLSCIHSPRNGHSGRQSSHLATSRSAYGSIYVGKLLQLQLIHSYVPQKSYNLSPLSFMTPKPNFPGTSSLAVNVITPYLSVQISHHHTNIMTTATSKRVLQLVVKFILFLIRHIFLGACVCITVSFLCFK